MLVLFEFARATPAFLRDPGGYLSKVDFDDAKRASEYFAIGVALTTVLSYLNFRFSPLAGVSGIERIISDTSISFGLALNAVVVILAAHVVFRLLRSTATFKRTFISLGYALAFLWPATSVALIALSRLVSLLTGVPWIAIPPLSSRPVGPIEATSLNLLAVSVAIVAQVALIAYLVSVYFRALSASHGLNRVRTGFGVAGMLLVSMALSRPIAALAVRIADTLGPVTGKILELMKPG